MGRISRDARLLFIEMWTKADDEGRLRGNPKMLAASLFPYDEDAPGLIDGWLDQLAKEGCIVRYAIAGDSYIQVVKFLQHQRIDKPKRSKIPPPSETVQEPSDPNPRLFPDESRQEGIKDQGRDQGSGKGEEGKGSGREGMPLPHADARGEISPASHITEDSLNSGWWQFHDALKLALCNVPLGHPNFSDVVRGETDWGSCFADWRLERATRTPVGLQLHTVSPRRPTTEAGLHKYSRRIAMLAEQTFGCAVEFRVQGASP